MSANNKSGFTSTEYYKFLSEHKLMASRCNANGAVYLPPRAICPATHSSDMEWVELSGKGKLIAFTVIILAAPTAMLEAGYSRTNPYCTGIVQLEEGPTISAQILGVDVAHPEKIAIGTPVQATFIERGEGDKRRTYLAFQA